MDVGSLEIAGTMDTSQITNGLNQVENQLQDASNSAQNAQGSMQQLGGTLEGMTGPLAMLGTTIAGAFTTLAMMSPQAAPQLARMKTEFTRLSMVVGEAFQPVLESASESFSGFVDYMEKNQGTLRTVGDIIEGIAAGFGDLAEDVETITKTINFDLNVDYGKLGKQLGPEAIATLIGAKFGGPMGAAAGFAGVSTIETAASTLEAVKEGKPVEGVKNWFAGEEGTFWTPMSGVVGPLLRMGYNYYTDSGQEEEEKKSSMKNSDTG